MKRGGGPKVRRKRAEFGNSIPVRPSFLNGEAKEQWDAIVAYLHEAGLLAEVDEAVISTYCVTFQTWKGAAEVVQRLGPTTTNGKFRNEYAIANKSALLLEKLSRILLLNPMSRAAAGRIDPPKEPSPMRKIMEKRR